MASINHENPYQAPQSVEPDNSPVERSHAVAEQTLEWTMFSMRGRMPRRAFWSALCISPIFGLLILLLIPPLENAGVQRSIGLIAVFPLLWIMIAVQAKRWHDRDKSAWWILINLLPGIGALWAFVELGFLPGTEGANRYGPSPVETSS